MPRIDLFYYGDTSPGQTTTELYRDIEEQVILGEQLGYEGVWFTEHHQGARGRIPDPLLFLARLSGATSRIRLGTSIVCAPFYHPLRLAESALLLDAISGGRLDLGIGSGAGDPALIKLFGLDSDLAARSREVFEIVRQVIDDGVVNFQGTYYQIEDAVVYPPASRPARDIIWVAAGRNAIDLARDHGYRLMIPRPLPLEERLQFNAEYRAVTGDQGQVIHLRSGLVAETRQLAREKAVEFLRDYAAYYLGITWSGGPDSAQFDELAEKLSFAVGTAGDVADSVWRWTDQFDGTEVTAIQFQGPGVAHSDALRSIELFSAELPGLRSGSSRRSDRSRLAAGVAPIAV